MKKIEAFFAPCLELLTWGEIKITLLLSFATARRTSKVLFRMFWWAILVIFSVFSFIGLQGSGVLRDFSLLKSHLQGNPLMGFSVFSERVLDILSVYSFSRGTSLAHFLPALALLLVVFFAGVIAALMVRASREAKDTRYLAQYLNTYFHVLYAFPVSWFVYYLSTTVWHLSLFFFFDGEPSWQSFKKSIIDAFNLYVRFLPFIFFLYLLLAVYVAFGFILASGVLALSVYLVGVFAQINLWLELVGYVGIFAASLPLVWGLFVVSLMPLAISNTLYIKVTSRFKELFSQTSSEE